jgi:hypothetical protein
VKIPTKLCPNCRQWYEPGTAHICLDKTVAQLKDKIVSLMAHSKAEYNRGYNMGSGNEGAYQRKINRLENELTAALLERDIAERTLRRLIREEIDAAAAQKIDREG